VIAAASKLREWRENPVTFVREVLHVEPDAWQAEFLHAFVKNQRLALKACKGPGKSTVLAWVGWNFLLTRPHPKVVCTSITGDNLKDGLWTELSKWQQKSPLLSKAFTWAAERITSNDHPETWWASARSWAKGADASQQANTLAGIHADYVLFLVDEAGGIPDGVVAAAEAGLATGKETKMCIAGNPTHLSGPLYRACERDRALWWVKEISSAPDDPNRTPRVDKEWAQQQIDKYGRDNPWVLINVFGEFPPGQSNALLGVEDAAKASRRVIGEAEYASSAKVLGVDVARQGDDRTVIFARQGRAAFKPKVFRNLNIMETADQVVLAIRKFEPDAVFVDGTGGYGAGVVDRLRQLGHSPIEVQFGGKATNERYLNKRAEMWFDMAEWVKGGGCTPDDAELIAELTAPTYAFNSAGKMVLEAKEHIKARGLPSPDKGDALALTFASPVAKRVSGPLQVSNVRGTDSYDPFRRLNKRSA
jgi:phage terminase large subunit